MTVIDLSPSMIVRLREWYRLGWKLDEKLLFECAYYPRGGCQDCRWDDPNPDCKWSHILIDTRCGEFVRVRKPSSKKKKGGDSLEKMLMRLPEVARQEILKVLEGR